MGVEPRQIPAAGKQNQFFLCSRSRHIDQFLIVFQPSVGLGEGLIGDRQGKQNNILFVSLEGMDGTALNILNSVFSQFLVDTVALIGKGRNNTDFFVSVFLYKFYDFRGFRRRGIFSFPL